MKNNKKLGLFYIILSFVCITAAILFFLNTDSMGMGTLWLIFGGFNVCMACIVTKDKQH